MIIRLTFISTFLFSLHAFGYPEMIRHGYVNCAVCHASGNGGDLTTAYGKELGKELIAPKTPWFSADLPMPQTEWFRMGINNRWLQTYVDNSQITRGRFFLMQLDLDTFLNSGRWSAYASVGRYEPTLADKTWSDFVYSPRLWIRARLLDPEASSQLNLRAGRFLPSYGVRLAEHTYVTRMHLNLGPGQERKAIELQWIHPENQMTLTRIEGRHAFNEVIDERGWVAQLSHAFSTMVNVGVNIYRTESLSMGNTAFDGVYLLVGWQDTWAALFELDRVYLANGKTSYLNLFRVTKELKPGWTAFFTQEYRNPDIEKTDPHFEALGLGTQAYASESLNLTAAIRLEKNSAVLDEHQKVLWMLLQWSPN